MTELRVKDLGGATVRCVDVCGYIVPNLMRPATELKTIFDNIPNLPLRDDDIMLCNFPKAGTHWLHEILTMCLNKSANRIEGSTVSTFISTFIEAQTEEEMDKETSPRVMHTHLDYRFLPKDMRRRNTKTILILRNPKDVAVSYFNHMKGLNIYEYDGQWKDWLPLWMEGKLEYTKYSQYLKNWERAMSEGVGFPLHVVYYEDFKLNGKDELRRLDKFLGTELDERTMSDIVDMCGFDKMEEKGMPQEIAKKWFVSGFTFYRKGQIGDWKNWFTVAQDEEFNHYWDDEMKGCTTYAFNYTG